jgi:polyisoprenoid-binding protein YceI
MQTTPVFTKTKWRVDQAHSQIDFSIKHLMFSTIRGSFNEFDASIYTIGEDFRTAEIDLWLNPASIDTGEEKRDAHLKGIEFFDVGRYKVINFASNFFVSAEKDGHYELHGELTVKEIVRQIKLDVEFGGIVKDPVGNQKALFRINGKITRSNWGLNWNVILEKGGVLVSDDVWISCEIQLIKQS